MNNKGQIPISVLLSIAAFIGAIIAPTLYVGGIKEVNAVQDVRILTIEKTSEEIKTDVKEIRQGMNALLLKNGINPDKLK